MGEIVQLREKATNARTFFACSIIFNAVFDLDIGCISQIAIRVDGTVPLENERDKCANLVGDAIEDVMNYEDSASMQVLASDLAIIALAKAMIYIAIQPVGKNTSLKKDREKALDIVLNRIGGRKSEPVKEDHVLTYVEPDWMKGLPDEQRSSREDIAQKLSNMQKENGQQVSD